MSIFTYLHVCTQIKIRIWIISIYIQLIHTQPICIVSTFTCINITHTCIYISHVYTSDHIITCKLWAFCMHTRAQSRMHTRACKHNRTYTLSLCLIHTPTLTYVYIHIDYTPAWEHFLFLSTCSQIAPFHYWDSPSNSSAVSLVVTWHAFRKQGIPLHELLHLPIRA